MCSRLRAHRSVKPPAFPTARPGRYGAALAELQRRSSGEEMFVCSGTRRWVCLRARPRSRCRGISRRAFGAAFQRGSVGSQAEACVNFLIEESEQKRNALLLLP